MDLTSILARVVEGLAPFIEATVVVFTLLGVLVAVKVVYDFLSRWRVREAR